MDYGGRLAGGGGLRASRRATRSSGYIRQPTILDRRPCPRQRSTAERRARAIACLCRAPASPPCPIISVHCLRSQFHLPGVFRTGMETESSLPCTRWRPCRQPHSWRLIGAEN